MRKLALALAGMAMMAGSASAQTGEFSGLSGLLAEKYSPFSAQMALEGQNNGLDRALKVYFVPGKVRFEGAQSGLTAIAYVKERTCYLNFQGSNWVKMSLTGADKTGNESLDQSIASLSSLHRRKLGTQKYEGKVCLLTETKSDVDGSTLTTWVWREKHVPLLIVKRDRKGQALRYRFSNVRFAPPAASLFMLPSGAKVMSVQEANQAASADSKK